MDDNGHAFLTEMQLSRKYGVTHELFPVAEVSTNTVIISMHDSLRFLKQARGV